MAVKSLGELLRHVDAAPLLHAATVAARDLSESPSIQHRDILLLAQTIFRLESAIDHANMRLHGKPYYAD